MKKIIKTSIFVGIGSVTVILLFGWLFFYEKIEKSIFQEEAEIFQENIKSDVVLVIDDGQYLSQLFEVEHKEGMTAFDLLEVGAERLDLILKTRSYDLGIFIEAIGDRENGQEGKYWLYYVNEEMPMVASDKNEVKPGDKVEFKFEESTF